MKETFRKMANVLRDTQWGEIIALALIFVSLVLLFIFQLYSVPFVFLLAGLGVLLTSGFLKREIVSYFFSSIGYVALAGAIYYICVNPEFLRDLLKTDLSITNLPLLWKVWLASILFLVVIFVYEATIKKSMAFTGDASRIGSGLVNLLFQVLVLLVFLLVVFKALEFLAFNTVVEGKKYDFTLQVIGLLFTFISVVIAAGYFLIQKRIEKIDRLEEMLRVVDELLGYSASLVVSNLPSFSTTQHIPYKDYRILGELVNLYEKSDHFKSQIDKKPRVSSKVYLALGLYYYGRRDYRCVNYLEKILAEHKKRTEIEKEVYSLVLWRLGIAFMAHFNNIERARTYWKMMREELPEYSQMLGKTADSLSRLAEYRRTHGSRFWSGNESDDSGLLRGTLEKQQKSRQHLLEKYDVRDLFASWYLLNVKYEMNESLNTDDEKDIEFVAKELVEVFGRTQDLAVRANYAMSLEMLKVICTDSHLHKDKDNEGKVNNKGKVNIDWLNKNRYWFNENWRQKAEDCAHQILYEHPDYDVVNSEKEISEVSVREFLDHMAGLREP